MPIEEKRHVTEIIVVDNGSTDSICGYDETMYMGEDVDFHWRLKRFAKRHHARVCFMEDIQVIPSTRRFDGWSFWRMLLWTNHCLF